MKKIFTLFVAALTLVAFSGCGGSDKKSASGSDELSGTISISGAFALYPLGVRWAQEFQKLHPDVTIDISAGGAGKGITDVIANQVDIAMVSRDLKEAETAKGAYPIAVARDAVVPTINAKNPVLQELQQHGLSAETAKGIWITGSVKTWGQVVGSGNATKINVYTRSDACGASETFASWFGATQEQLGGTGVYGDPGLAQQVGKDPNGIGMNNIAFCYDEKTGKPLAGLAVPPLDANGNGKIDPEENVTATKADLIKAIIAGNFPTPPARNLYLVTNGKPENKVVKAFLDYVLGEGQKLNEPTGYIRIN